MLARTLIPCCLFFFAVFPAAAEETPWSQAFQDTTEVRVINIEAFVTDKKGELVAGLTRDDFELSVGGELLEIANFYAVQGGETLATLGAEGTEEAVPVGVAKERELLLLFFIDNANIGPNSRKRVFGRLKEFLLANWRPNLQVMLATNERTVLVRQNVTEVPHLVFVALEEIEQTIASGNQLGIERGRILRAIQDINVDAAEGFFALSTPENDGGEGERERAINDALAVVPQLRAYAQQQLDRTLESIGILRSFVDSVGGLPGNKAVVYVGDELSLRPGAALFELFGRRVEKISELGPQFNGSSESARFDASRALKGVVDHANASNVTLHVLDATPPSTLGRGSAEGSNILTTNEFASLEESNRRDSKQMLAQGTGGRANLGSDDFESVLEGVLEDFDNHYSLGYLANGAPQGDQGEALPVVVRMKDPNLKVRHRRTFSQRSTDDEMGQRVLSALILDAFENPMGAELEVRDQKQRADGNFEVPLRIKVPLGKLVLLPEGKEHRAQVSLYVAVRDGRGRSSRVVKHQCPIRIPNQDMLVALGRSAACGVQLAMRGGPHTVAVVIRDDVAGIDSTLRTAVDIVQDGAEQVVGQKTLEGSR